MPDPSQMFGSTLDDLVSDGTITSAQETAISEALSSAMQQGGSRPAAERRRAPRRRPDGGPADGGPGGDASSRRPALVTSAAALTPPPSRPQRWISSIALPSGSSMNASRGPSPSSMYGMRVTRPPNSSSTGSTASMSSVSKAKWPNLSPPG